MVCRQVTNYSHKRAVRDRCSDLPTGPGLCRMQGAAAECFTPCELGNYIPRCVEDRPARCVPLEGGGGAGRVDNRACFPECHCYLIGQDAGVAAECLELTADRRLLPSDGGTVSPAVR